MANIERNLAGKVFKLQNSGGVVPSPVLAAARRVYAGQKSTADVSMIRSYLGISRSGATAQKKGLQGIQSTFGKVGQIGFLANQAGQGGTGGMFAGLQLTQVVGVELQKIVKSKSFEQLVTKSAMVGATKTLNAAGVKTPGLARALATGDLSSAQKALKGVTLPNGQAAYDPVAVGRNIYAVGRGLRGAGAVAGYALAGAAVTSGISSFAAGGGDERRTAEQDARIAILKSRSPLRRRSVQANLDADAPLSSVFSPFNNNKLGTIGSKLGFGATARGELETSADIRESGIGGLNVANMRSLARDKRLEKSGIFGRALNAITPEFLGGQAAADTKKAKEMLARAAEKTKEAYSALDSNDIATAQEAFVQAAQAVGKGKWKNATTEWFAMDAARGAKRMYAASQSPTPALRIGE